jgi:hypothetical protein
VTLRAADITRWDPGDIREVAAAAQTRAQAALDAADRVALSRAALTAPQSECPSTSSALDFSTAWPNSRLPRLVGESAMLPASRTTKMSPTN